MWMFDATCVESSRCSRTDKPSLRIASSLMDANTRCMSVISGSRFTSRLRNSTNDRRDK